MGMRWSFCCRRSPGARQQLQDDFVKELNVELGMACCLYKGYAGLMGSCELSAIVGPLKFLTVMHSLCERRSDLFRCDAFDEPGFNTCLQPQLKKIDAGAM